jgi:hypothetical protein
MWTHTILMNAATKKRTSTGRGRKKAAAAQEVVAERPALPPVEVGRLDEARFPLHAGTREWVAFADLHCSAQTLSTCMEVGGPRVP